jgi:hypothetical protein
LNCSELHNCSKTTENDFVERKIFYMIACSLCALVNARKFVEVWRERESLDGLMTRAWTYFVALVMKTIFRVRRAQVFRGDFAVLLRFDSFRRGNEA